MPRCRCVFSSVTCFFMFSVVKNVIEGGDVSRRERYATDSAELEGSGWPHEGSNSSSTEQSNAKPKGSDDVNRGYDSNSHPEAIGIFILMLFFVFLFVEFISIEPNHRHGKTINFIPNSRDELAVMPRQPIDGVHLKGSS